MPTDTTSPTVTDADAADDDDELAPGTIVGEYRIEKVIGSGGMGIVYGAVHPLIGKRAAIKVLHGRSSVDREGVARFVQEAQVVNQIGHANIVDIFSFGTLPDGRAYFAMEWLVGESLKTRIERGVVPIAEAVTILVALARAIEAAHAAGVIHRDLKPDNVFLVAGDDGDAVRVKLLDFGIAKLATAQPSASKTATGTTVGTPAYMSPEQARGHELDGRTDAYSLGVVAYELVTGRTPFETEPSPVEVLHAHLAKPPRPPAELRSELPRAFEAIILELLAKQAADRPALVDVRARLGAIAVGPVVGGVTAPRLAMSAISSRTTEDLEVVEPPARRTGLLFAVLVAVVLAVGGVVAAIAMSHDDVKPAAAPAVTAPAPPPPPSPSPSPPPPSPSPSPSPPPSPSPSPSPSPPPSPSPSPPSPSPSPSPSPPPSPSLPVKPPHLVAPVPKPATTDVDGVVNPFEKK